MKRLTLLVVAVTCAMLMWVPARGERRSGKPSVQLPNPRPYVFDLCTGDFKHGEQSCILPSNGKYFLWAGDLGRWSGTYRWECKNRNGKGNDESQYPCIFDNGAGKDTGRFYMYLGDIT